MATVVIGIDPHKGSHTAVALDGTEALLGRVKVRAAAEQVQQLQTWARRWDDRVWAIEGSHGLAHLLAQQLVAVGEHVVDVQPKLAARVRLLNNSKVNKNDPNDARSVAIAALRSPGAEPVTGEGSSSVLKLWAHRHRELSRRRNRMVCQLHSLLCDLVPGGFAGRITASLAAASLERIEPLGAASEARMQLARDLLEDSRCRRATPRREEEDQPARHRLQTTVTDVYGVGPVVAATVLGFVGDVGRFASRDAFAAYNGTAPIEASSGNRHVHRLSLRGNRQMNHAIHMAAVAQIAHPNTEGRAYYDRKIAAGMQHRSAIRALKRKISDAIYRRLVADVQRQQALCGPGGQPGNDSVSSAAGSHPAAPALRTSHSRTRGQPRTANTTTTVLTTVPAPRRRQTGRSAAGVKMEPRQRPHSGRRQERS